jgi:hypothetical protein
VARNDDFVGALVCPVVRGVDGAALNLRCPVLARYFQVSRGPFCGTWSRDGPEIPKFGLNDTGARSWENALATSRRKAGYRNSIDR